MSTSGARCKVLIADDDSLSAIALRSLLIENGFEAVGIADGEDEAMRLTADLRPHIAIVDINLRSGSGLIVADFARRSYGTRVIIVSGYIDEHLSVLPADSLFVRKPYDPKLLVEAALSLCRGRNHAHPLLPAGIQSVAGQEGPGTHSGRSASVMPLTSKAPKTTH